VLLRSSIGTFTPENVAAARIRGHELSVRTTLFDRLLFTANYTHQDAIDASGERAYDGNRLPGRPVHEAYARLELVWSPARPLPWAPLARLWPGRVFYDVNLIAENFLTRFNIERPSNLVGSRALHGVGADVTIPWWDLRVAFEVKNLTDDQTSDAAGFPLPGRSLFVTLSHGFGPAAADARER
jgi:outer membrane cobalamin receptor